MAPGPAPYSGARGTELGRSKPCILKSGSIESSTEFGAVMGAFQRPWFVDSIVLPWR